MIGALLFALLATTQGVLLEDLTWIEAEKVLRPETVVVIPLGAASKEHGPHLKLKNDLILANDLKERVRRRERSDRRDAGVEYVEPLRAEAGEPSADLDDRVARRLEREAG